MVQTVCARTTQHWKGWNSKLEKQNGGFGFYVIQCRRGNLEGISPAPYTEKE